ncbi:MAG: hypothetical protein NT032_07670, partial [Actinobacteria bacterium]|nr:hypothetical protein [Actinomycetota bacterium]
MGNTEIQSNRNLSSHVQRFNKRLVVVLIAGLGLSSLTVSAGASVQKPANPTPLAGVTVYCLPTKIPYILVRTSKCEKGEKTLTFNTVGPQGPAGAAGAT